MGIYDLTVGNVTRDRELHFPGYQFCGPGTKVEERIGLGQRGINDLDAACMEHDLAYLHSNDPHDRRVADEHLEKRAFHNVFNPRASVKERGWSLLTGVGMRFKRGLNIY